MNKVNIVINEYFKLVQFINYIEFKLFKSLKI
jgi:hypothetical protein